MSQYTVPQNVEAEDQIIGSLTFKQFVYAMIGFGWAALAYAAFNKIIVVMIIVILPVTSLFLALAFYRRDGQNFEQLLIALVGYLGNTRKRLWAKSDTVETLRIEAKKTGEEQTQRNAGEVKGELERLSSLLDSRGWNQEQTAALASTQSQTPVTDRIVQPTVQPSDITNEVKASDDILDLQNSPLAQNLAGLIQQASEDVRREAISQMKAPAPAPAVPNVPIIAGAPVVEAPVVPVTPPIQAAKITTEEAAQLIQPPAAEVPLAPKAEPAPMPTPAPVPAQPTPAPVAVPSIDEIMKKMEAAKPKVQTPAPVASTAAPTVSAPAPAAPEPAKIPQPEIASLQDILAAPVAATNLPGSIIQPQKTEVTTTPPEAIIDKKVDTN